MCVIKWERPDRLVELMGSLPSLSNGSPWALGVEIWHRNIWPLLDGPNWICRILLPLNMQTFGKRLDRRSVVQKNNTSEACTCCIPSWCFLRWCGSGQVLPGLQTRLWNAAQSCCLASQCGANPEVHVMLDPMEQWAKPGKAGRFLHLFARLWCSAVRAPISSGKLFGHHLSVQGIQQCKASTERSTETC